MSEAQDGGSNDALRFEKHGGIATLTMNRPEARNALTTGMFLDMERILIDIEADADVRVVVITGTGRGFSAGADLKPVSKEERRRTEAPSFPGDRGGDILVRANRCILRLQQLPKPVIASINGDAVGVACSLALAADFRIASEAARLGVVFSKIGLGPDGGASYFLPKLVGTAKALELMFLGDLVEAPEAHRIGLVNRVVASESLAKETAGWAERFASGPTLAYAMAKEAVFQGANLPLESVLDLEARNQQTAARSQDAKEGIRAFLEKRKANFQGY
jgi:2-(1,2-epoxy-1,2-dihydrophenyl)acetyl-CoA isomerase